MLYNLSRCSKNKNKNKNKNKKYIVNARALVRNHAELVFSLCRYYPPDAATQKLHVIILFADISARGINFFTVTKRANR